MPPSFVLADLLCLIQQKKASDLHLKDGRPPMMRVDGDLIPMENYPVLTSQDIQRGLFSEILESRQRELLEQERELDFSFNLRGVSRFRGNAFFQKGSMGAVFRVIPNKIPTLEELGLSSHLKKIVSRQQGFFLVTGPTGSGKTTTLAALVDEINTTQRVHIVTLEDPIEYVFEDKLSVVNQREVGSDTLDFPQGLRRALRQDPDVILIGELRDSQTMAIALNAAETGHLVLGTLHTNDAKQTIDRIIDSFPPEQHHQIRVQLSRCLIGVLAQRLVRRFVGEGRLALQEIMINTPTVQKLIEENKIGGIGKAIEDSSDFYGTQSFNQDLFTLITTGQISLDEGMSFSPNPNDLKIRLQTAGFGGGVQAVGVQPSRRIL